MNDANSIANRYIRSWNETDPVCRRALLQETCTEHVTYTDPLATAAGLDAIDAAIAAVQRSFPGHRFSLGGKVDAHHDVMRFSWHLTSPGTTEPLVVGFDVAVVENDRIARIAGFLDKVPAAG